MDSSAGDKGKTPILDEVSPAFADVSLGSDEATPLWTPPWEIKERFPGSC